VSNSIPSHLSPHLPSPYRTGRKRAVNLTLSEVLVEQARAYTDNLSATMERLLSDYVQAQQRADQQRLARARACAAQWNAFHEGVGSFADQHTTL
jgi:antitoxin CcdA